MCHATIFITVTLPPYWERNGSENLTTRKKIKDKTAVVNAIDIDVNYYYQKKGVYNESQSSSKEFMINLTSKHENIELGSGCLLWNKRSEKRGKLVSKGCFSKGIMIFLTITLNIMNHIVLCLIGM